MDASVLGHGKKEMVIGGSKKTIQLSNNDDSIGLFDDVLANLWWHYHPVIHFYFLTFYFFSYHCKDFVKW